MSQLLDEKISAVRARHLGVAAGTGAALSIAWFVGGLLACLLADWLFDLSWSARAVLFALNAATATFLLARQGIYPIVYGPDDEDIALEVEHMEPGFDTRLIAAVQFEQAGTLAPNEAPGLVRAMLAQTEELAAQINFNRVVRLDNMWRLAVAAAVVLVVAIGVYGAGGETARVLFQRAFLLNTPMPTRTSVEVLSGSQIVARGDSIILKARAHGWKPDVAYADIDWAGGRTQRLTMESVNGEPDTYAVQVDAIGESFTYRVRMNDGVSTDYQVQVETRPAITALTCTQIFPDYLGSKKVNLQPTELSLLQGSRLQLKIIANKPLRSQAGASKLVSRVQLIAREGTAAIAPVALHIDPVDRRQATVDLTPPENTTGLAIHLVDDHDITSGDPTYYPVDMLPDRPPTIRIVLPERKVTLVTTDTKLNVVFQAEDDFLLGKVVLKYTVDGGPEQAINLALPANQKSFHGLYGWQVGKIVPPPAKASLERCVVDYWLEVRDTNTVSGPGIGLSEHYELHVVNRQEKQAELMARLGESLGAIRDVSQDQEDASQELGGALTNPGAHGAPSTTNPAPATAP
jgi:hypothetical protein